MFHARWALAIATGCAVTPSGIRLAIAEVRAPLMKQGPTIDDLDTMDQVSRTSSTSRM